MELLPLHKNFNYMDPCVDVLNEEWPRSKSARLHMLQKSRDSLPYSMVLIDSEDGDIVGHSRLCKVQGYDNACFIESVVVRKSLRGKGFGKILMKKTEESAIRLGFNTAFLTTHDKQDFYAHLNYEYCEPVVSLGGASALLSEEQLQRLFGGSQDKNKPAQAINSELSGLKSKDQKDAENILTKTMTNSDSLSNIGELAQGDGINQPLSGSNMLSVDSTESIHCISSHGPVPPPPPPLSKTASNDSIVHRIPSNSIYWMKKSLN